MKQKTKVIIKILCMLAVTIAPIANKMRDSFAEDTDFEVNVKETLSVAVTETSVDATGNINQFLRNQINVAVTSNNASGFEASMTTKSTSPALVNTVSNTSTIPTLSSSVTCTSSTCDAFPANYWGYSFNDGSNTGKYESMVGSTGPPIEIMSYQNAAYGSQDIYFGAKADSSTASGTYLGTVVISVVTGTINETTNPTTPTDPATPAATDQVAEYNPGVGTGTSTASGTTSYSYTTTTSGISTRTTQVSEGDNRSSYADPQGVTTNISSGSSLATGLAVTAASATASGLFFLILAKRKQDDDEEEEENLQ